MDIIFKICVGNVANALYRSLIAEVNQEAPKKGKVSIEYNNDCLYLTISSDTLSGLRALSNSYLNLIYAMLTSFPS
jgi:tRNA threonylcarbamoyladenosine modification (KEOPS) complex  Pcc1 subunit